MSREDISAMVSVATEEEVIEKEEKKMIQNLLKLDELTAHEIMTPSTVVEMAEGQMTIREFYDSDLTHSRILVYDEDNSDYVIGYVLRQTVLEKMAEVLLERTGLTGYEAFQPIHNYIDVDEMILRKGSVSAKQGEKLLIPINMRDGSLICIGKGNPDWNFSAPHGAGRIMSRKQALTTLSLDEYKKSMENIFSTCINKDTLDESPMSYKNMDEIVSNISPTAEIIKIIKPVYNFKAAE